MRTRIAKWGNSLAVRIPKEVAQEARLREDDALDVSVAEDGAVLLKPLNRPVTLAELVARITPANRHGEDVWGKRKGNETW